VSNIGRYRGLTHTHTGCWELSLDCASMYTQSTHMQQVHRILSIKFLALNIKVCKKFFLNTMLAKGDKKGEE
jgi:hypothetical protein